LTTDIDSFRPINNLSTLDKIIEQHIKINLENYLDINNIILKNHHGSRKYHGTNTAITQISNQLNINYEQNKVSATVITDLSAAFNTANKIKLLKKLQYYGIDNQELALFSYFLSDRSQYVSIDSFDSKILMFPPAP